MTPFTLPPAVLRAVDAANAGDIEDFLGSFAEDGAVDDWGRVFRGPAAIRGWSDKEFIGVRVSLTVTGVRQNGDTVVVSAMVGGDGFNGPSDFAFTVEDDRVSLMRITG
ncbi:nuclear transport factor 2 family protein [Sphaerisporangium rhizosphaerae]|uniref:Nuclear transport factor 2 family protein n=1 Tax=Sphaerisporangium rhizosphaerae TaxID=2269375 RepID=A0ABW2NY34_9ACTN